MKISKSKKKYTYNKEKFVKGYQQSIKQPEYKYFKKIIKILAKR